MAENSRIRACPALAEELEAAAELRHQLGLDMNDDWDTRYVGWRERFVSYFNQMQVSGNSQVILAKSDDEIIGMIVVSLIDDYHIHVRGKRSGRVNAVYVKPQFRRLGAARLMMEEGMRWLKERGCESARLNSSEQGIFLYESLGFKPRREMELKL